MTSLPEHIILPGHSPSSSSSFSPSTFTSTLDIKSPSPFTLSHHQHNHTDSTLSESCPQLFHTDQDVDTMPIGLRVRTPSSRVSSTASTPTMSKTAPLSAEEKDVFRLEPTVALTLLARSIEVLVSLTGDVPPTPPLSGPSSPNMFPADASPHCDAMQSTHHCDSNRHATTGYAFGAPAYGNVDGVRVKRNRNAPHAESAEEEGKLIAAGVDNAVQYSAITRKFWSKSVPEVPIEDYIFRIHRFCPMSTAVYVAASLYLHRIAVLERVIPITRFNVHRLVLAALRVASKALEDLSHSHKRFAKVGGLSENELARLEVSFCFLVNFELKVDKATLERHVIHLRNIAARQAVLGKPVIQPRMPKELVVRNMVLVDV